MIFADVFGPIGMGVLSLMTTVTVVELGITWAKKAVRNT